MSQLDNSALFDNDNDQLYANPNELNYKNKDRRSASGAS